MLDISRRLLQHASTMENLAGAVIRIKYSGSSFYASIA